MAHKVIIDPTPEQRVARHKERVKTLKLKIHEAMAAGNKERADSLQAELTRRLDEVKRMKAELDSIDA